MNFVMNCILNFIMFYEFNHVLWISSCFVALNDVSDPDSPCFKSTLPVDCWVVRFCWGSLLKPSTDLLAKQVRLLKPLRTWNQKKTYRSMKTTAYRRRSSRGLDWFLKCGSWGRDHSPKILSESRLSGSCLWRRSECKVSYEFFSTLIWAKILSAGPSLMFMVPMRWSSFSSSSAWPSISWQRNSSAISKQPAAKHGHPSCDSGENSRQVPASVCRFDVRISTSRYVQKWFMQCFRVLS